jgi:murein DD-endopeptidase MepM/ murein hydrolase activator NlpD
MCQSASEVTATSRGFAALAVGFLLLLDSLIVKTVPRDQDFTALPSEETIRIAWPTPNHLLFDTPERFFARTRVNADYGKPGWTRDCGKRFHRGCDIAPVNVTATGQTTRVIFTDCATNRDFEGEEPTFVPHDDVFCVFDGVVHEVVTDENVSDFGKHAVIQHIWPHSGAKFFTLYGHLAEVAVGGQRSAINGGQTTGRMGQTSRSADARNWMAIAPHLHFEVRDAGGQSYDPVEFLKRFLRRS